jgi:hypothetical protein
MQDAGYMILGTGSWILYSASWMHNHGLRIMILDLGARIHDPALAKKKQFLAETKPPLLGKKPPFVEKKPAAARGNRPLVR